MHYTVTGCVESASWLWAVLGIGISEATSILYLG